MWRDELDDHRVAEPHILFLGCLAVTLTEVRMKGAALASEALNSKGAKFFVRVAVLPTKDSGTEERMGEFVDSSAYPLNSAELTEDLLIPVLLEKALNVSTNGFTPSGATQEVNDQIELNTSASTAAGAPENENDVDKQKKEKKEEKVRDGDKNNDGNVNNNNNIVEQCSDNHQETSVELHLEFIVACGDQLSTVAHRTVTIDSLLNIAHEKCGVVNARLATMAALLNSSVWGEGLSVPAAGWSMTSEENGDDDGSWSGVELQFILRFLDMSEPVRVMLTAESEARTLLRMSQAKLRMKFLFPALRLPYASLPLLVMYQYYRRFYEQLFNKTLRLSNYVERLLAADEDSTQSRRWSALRVIDMRPTLLGEDALAPLLATIYHCPSLRSLMFDQNGAGDFTCYWLSALFHKHRYLSEVSLCRNNIHECGAEQLLRFARRNKRLTRLDASGNPCSPRVLERIARVTAMNKETLRKDPFNVVSTLYDYAVSPTSFASSITKKALSLWAMLSACSLKATDSAFESDRPSIIPQVAKAPLLNEVMRTVALEISSLTQDPFVCMVFADIETQQKATNVKRREDANSAVAKGNAAENVDLTTAAGEYDDRDNDSADSAAEDLYSYSFLRIIVVTMRSIMREGDWAESTRVLQGIGRRQKEIGVVAEDYCAAVRTFIQSLTTVCGREPVDAQNSAAFLQCLAMGVRTSLSE